MSTPTSEVVKRLIATGYPESVARRIASGELPMDAASQAARRDAFGVDAYHLTNKDFNEFKLGGYDPELSGEAVWMAPTKQETYPAAHNVYLPLNDPSKYAEILEKQAGMQMGGGKAGAIGARVMPLKVNVDNSLSIDEYNLKEMQDRWAGGSREFPYIISPETSQKLRDAGFDSVLNEIGMWSDNYDVKDAEIISLDPSKIRSVNAAFDPEYTGSNILGSRVAPTVTTGLLGAGAMMAPDDAEAGTMSNLAKGATEVASEVNRLIGLGYPDSVAQRIASGDLVMDYASRMQRAGEQGYDLTPLYSGYDAIRGVRYDGTAGNQPITRVTDRLWTSDNPLIAGTYSASKGGGNIHPLLMRSPDAVIDAKGNSWMNLLGIDVSPDTYSKQFSTNDFVRQAQSDGANVAEIQNVVDYGNKAGKMNRLYPDFEELTKGGSNVRVDMTGNNTRSLLSAAFDPEYVGPNILGNADPMLLAGLAGGSLLGAVAPKVKSEEAKTKEVDPFVQALMDYTSDANFLPSPSERLIPMSEIPAEMKANNPDRIRDITNWAGNAMGGDYYDYRAAEGLMNVADFLPYIGGGISLQQGADAYRNNRKWEGRLLTGLGLLEVIPYLGRMASESIVPAVRPTMKKWDESDSLLRLLEQQ